MSFPRYERYKDSGVDWLGETPKDWKTQRFDEVSKTHKNTVTPEGLKDRTVLHYSIPHVQEFGCALLQEGAEIDSNKLIVSERQLLVSKLNPHKQTKVVAEVSDHYLTVASTEFVPLIPAGSDLRYITYVWESDPVLHYLLSRCESATRSHQRVNPDDIAKATWSFPSLREQATIATFLDQETATIDALIEEQRRLIELLKEKRQAVISHAVTKGLRPTAPTKHSGIDWFGTIPKHWSVSRSGRHTSILSGFAFPSAGFSEDDEDVRLLRGTNVGVGRIRWDDTVRWKREKDDGLDEFLLKQGDIVLGMDRPIIGDGVRVAEITQEDLPSMLLQRVARLSTDEHLRGRFLFALLASEFFVAHFAPETTGVSVPHISPQQIKDFIIPIPPVDEQASIIVFLEDASQETVKLISSCEVAISLLQERRSALISAAVTGKIDVRNYIPHETVAAEELCESA